jgi:hypothetical protein
MLRAGQRIFEFFTPAKLGAHRLYFTCAWTLIMFCTFFFMVGEFPYYQAVQWPDPTMSACLVNATATPMGYGSTQMLRWMTAVRAAAASPS